MAPINAARAVQQNRPRPTAAKNIIVPAIPLAYVQKRQKQSAAHTKAKIEQPVASNPPVVEFLPASPSPILEPAAAANSTSENGSPSPLQASTTSPASEADHSNESHHTESTEEEVAEPAIAEQEVSVVEESSSEEPQQTPRSAPSEAQSSASRTTYQMPPPFVPSSQSQQPNMSAADPGSMPPPPNFHHGQHPMHHAHPSAGSLRFGGYPESNNSSPAPPPSAGNLPPYPYPQSSHGPQRHGQQPPTNGGHPNGFSPMGPPPPPGYYARPDGMMNHGPNENFMRRQMPGFAPEGGYMPPPGFEHQRYNSFDPSTPHSFHGSQSSAQNDQENGPAFYSQYPTAVISNGSNGHIDEVRLYQQPPRPKPRTNSHAVNPSQNGFPHPAGQPPALIDNLDGLVGYLQGQFGDAQFADLTLELRYSDDRAAPVRIPGHNLMFARSPALHALMKAQNTNNDGVAMKTLLIETDDRYLRSDAFWMAMQRLYGGALLDIGAVASVNMLPNAQVSSSTSGIPSDRFELALGYAAAGKLLAMPPVMQRGVEIASHTINMSTLEKALEFALDGGLDYSWTREAPPDGARCPSTYGPLVNLLLTRCMQWIIAGITPGFELDASVGDFVHVRRLPEVPVDRPTTAPNPRLSQIKFGDHPTEESAIVQPSSANSDLLTLSKALINMPFHLLKHVLEAPQLGNAQGWATTALKQKVMYAVVEEREKRRLKVLRNPHVLTEERKTKRKAWEAVGWQESVEAHGTIEPTPILTRTWVDYVLPASPH
ncbi:hypothetical protein HYFRA_00013269 [Hymenoscyphus fraxineus]|uniref:Uncharacterized protein n=1 Tax=Hymenoscyphus fraxineus TaxID=746836 RepID=A0A9N9LB06_9HELO|nr:hypothetical protein HYFRA_00013269 [Hymenoscyphus fraxineus]